MPDWSTDGGVYFGQAVDPDEATPAASLLDMPWNPVADTHRYKSDRHIITIGPNGSGKTRRLLVPNLFYLKNWSILVVDPKGELAMQTAKHRRDAGSEIVTLDPFGVIEHQYPGLVAQQPYLKSAGLNPVGALDPKSDDFPDDAKAIGEALIKVESQNEAYWAKSAQALTAGLTMAARLEFDTDASLEIIRSLLGEDADALGAALKRRKPDDEPGLIDIWGRDFPEVAAKLNRFAKISGDNRELTGILSTAQTHTDWLDSRPIKADLNKGSESITKTLRAMKDRPVTVYLILPPRYLETHATWLRLMITAILTPLIRTTGGKVPVLFMLDEFAQLGRLEVIERNMALMRGYGIKLWAVLQDLSQLKANYTERWESFIGNAGVLQTFAPQDETTRDYLSKLSGKRLYWMKTGGTSTSQSGGDKPAHSRGVNEGWQHIEGPVFYPQGLGRMGMGQGVLFTKGDAWRTFLPDPLEMRGPAEMLRAAEAAAR